MKHLAILSILALCVPCFGQSIRPITQVNDVNTIYDKYYENEINWFVGDSVRYDVYARQGRTAIDFTGNAKPLFFVAAETNLTQVYIAYTGTVVSATNGHVRVFVPAERALLDPDIDYASWMTVVMLDGSETQAVSTVGYSAVRVGDHPFGQSFTFIPPASNAFSFSFVNTYNYTGTDLTARAWAQAASNLAAQAAADLLDKLDSNTAYATFALASDITGLGTDETARAWAVAASNIASQAATDLVDKLDSNTAYTAFALSSTLNAASNHLQAAIDSISGAIPLDARAATNTVDLSSNLVDNVSALQFTGGTGDQGTMSWNADEETVDLIQNGATLQLGQELHWHVRADGIDITNGQVVYASGTVGSSGRVKVKPYIANGGLAAHLILGIAIEDITDGSDGKVTSFGKVRGIPVTFPEGTVLYPSPTVAGGLTATKPTGTNVATEIAFAVTSNAVNGVLAVRVHPHNENEFTTDAELATAQADASNQFLRVASTNRQTVTGGLLITDGDSEDDGNVNDWTFVNKVLSVRDHLGGSNAEIRFYATSNRVEMFFEDPEDGFMWLRYDGVSKTLSFENSSSPDIVFTNGMVQAKSFISDTAGTNRLLGESYLGIVIGNTFTANSFTGVHIGDGSGLTDLDAGNLTAGTTATAINGAAITNVNAKTLETYTAQEVADLPRSTANFDYTTLTWSPTVTLSRATGNRQYIVTQGPTWFSVPAGATNQGYTIRLDVEQTTNEINFLPANLLISTNLFTYTNRTMSFLLDNSFNESGVALYSLPRSSE